MALKTEFGEINSSLIINFRLKAKMLGYMFSSVFCLQILGIIIIATQTNFIGTSIPVKIIIAAPILAFLAAASEFAAINYLKRLQGKEEQIKLHFIYLVTFIEVSFPAIIMLAIGNSLTEESLYTPFQILNSPLLIVFAIMIVLSSLLLDFKLCLFSGLIGGIEYLLISFYFFSLQREMNETDCISAIAKSVFIVVTGLFAGLVSKKIKEAIVSSLESKNELIFNLDRRVSEKTFEVTTQKTEIEKKNRLLEEKQKEILDSIHYAKRIQKTLLASKDLLNKNLPEHFVLYKPKDIVSGDFYWATNISLKPAVSSRHMPEVKLSAAGCSLFYLAVCDCTGHGVPGAFMSLLNISFLNEAITEKKILNPGEVFDHVRKRLIETISQDGGQDGMDGTLLCFETLPPDASEGEARIQKLTYSSAHNTPVLIRDNSIQILDADKMPVGKGEKNNPFNLFTIALKKNDILYFFTDGYADQFGGPKGKKFKYKQLEDILLSINLLPMKEQQEFLEKKFNNWKVDLEQVDDVLLIGIKI